MLIIATLLIAIGVVVGLLGAKLFRLILPVIGLVSGIMVGFLGVQAVFGTGVVATTMAIAIAVVAGLVLAILSFAFFEFAVIVYVALLGAAAMSYLGVALGLNEEGFLVLMLALAGGIMTAVWATRYPISMGLVVALTSFAGAAYVLAGFLLIAGNLSVDELNSMGVGAAILETVKQSFIWFFVWVGISLIAMQLQFRAIMTDLFNNALQYDDKRRSVL